MPKTSSSFTVDERHYYKSGVSYDRVTSVLAPFNAGVSFMKARNPNALAAKAATGKRAHLLAAKLARSEKIEDMLTQADPRAYNLFQSYELWFSTAVKKVIAVEATLFSADWRVAGTADLIAELKDGTKAVVDLKTGAASGTNQLQTAAYYHMAKNRWKGINRRLVVYAREGGYSVAKHDDHEEDWDTFCAAVTVYRRIISKE